MSYSVEIAPSAIRDLKKIQTIDRKRIDKKILSLSKNPLPEGVTKLAGEEKLYRVRVGDFRIIYQIRERELVVLVVRVRHRREVYRR